MPRTLDLPFFSDAHRELARGLAAFAAALPHHDDVPTSTRRAGRWCAPSAARAGCATACPRAHGGALPALDSRALCVARETLAYHDGLADFAFAMQGLGSGRHHARRQPRRSASAGCRAVARGEAIAAFALSEPDAGSDVGGDDDARDAATATHWVLDGCKTWISNGGIADFYCVFARTGEAAGAKGISAFVVPADAPGLDDRRAHRGDRAASARAARASTRAALPAAALLGAEGEGFKLAMRTLDIFRASVAAAALGFARRALRRGAARTRASGAMFGGTLADLQLTQATLGDMATAIDAAALLTYRAAWLRDVRARGRRRKQRWPRWPPPNRRSR